MSSYRTERKNGTYKGHQFSLTIKYLQETHNGYVANEFPGPIDCFVDGKIITLQTPGFKEVQGNPEQAVRDYIDYLVSQSQE